MTKPHGVRPLTRAIPIRLSGVRGAPFSGLGGA